MDIPTHTQSMAIPTCVFGKWIYTFIGNKLL